MEHAAAGASPDAGSGSGLAAKTIVAKSNSHGIMRSKSACGVTRSRNAPEQRADDAHRDDSNAKAHDARATSSRYPRALPIVPTHIAALLVAFAEIGGTPAKSSAGNERKLPPPATLFIAPATNAATAEREVGGVTPTSR